jgi:hypothetical protein
MCLKIIGETTQHCRVFSGSPYCVVAPAAQQRPHPAGGVAMVNMGRPTLAERRIAGEALTVLGAPHRQIFGECYAVSFQDMPFPEFRPQVRVFGIVRTPLSIPALLAIRT